MSDAALRDACLEALLASEALLAILAAEQWQELAAASERRGQTAQHLEREATRPGVAIPAGLRVTLERLAVVERELESHARRLQEEIRGELAQAGRARVATRAFRALSDDEPRFVARRV